MKIMLKFQNIKDSFPYESNKNKANSITYDRFSNYNFSIIDIDCQRTNFEEKQEERTQVLLDPLHPPAFGGRPLPLVALRAGYAVPAQAMRGTRLKPG